MLNNDGFRLKSGASCRDLHAENILLLTLTPSTHIYSFNFWNEQKICSKTANLSGDFSPHGWQLKKQHEGRSCKERFPALSHCDQLTCSSTVRSGLPLQDISVKPERRSEAVFMMLEGNVRRILHRNNPSWPVKEIRQIPGLSGSPKRRRVFIATKFKFMKLNELIQMTAVQTGVVQ